ncbi:MAG: ParB/RepB/Spo0J family partition protein [Gammaproteobacteria bacterium]
MSTPKKKGLGKGLDALLGAASKKAQQNVAAGDAGPGASGGVIAAVIQDSPLKELPVEFLQRGRYQPRREFAEDKLAELAESIKAQGLMQPIVVRPIGDRKYEIIAGERRWRASQLAGLEKVPCVIKDVGDEAALAMSLIENIQREDLSPMEEAIALNRLQEEFSLTHQQVADAVGKSRATVTNLLRLLSLAPEARTLLERGDLEMGHARAILALDARDQGEAARQVVQRALSVRQTEALVRKIQSEQQAAAKPAVSTRIDPDVRRLQDEISEKTGAPVQIQHTARGKGKLVINYNSLDELDGILRFFR